MAITSIKTGSSFTNLVKYNDFLGPNSAYEPSQFYSIVSATGTGSSNTISFTSIPATYAHLQIRINGRSTNVSTSSLIYLYINNDTTNANYARHRLSGDGATATAAGAADAQAQIIRTSAASAAANIMGTGVIDLLDYTSTTKYKTFRGFSGHDQNDTNGEIWLTSVLWKNTNAVNRIDLIYGSGSWTTNSTIALYGIKGA